MVRSFRFTRRSKRLICRWYVCKYILVVESYMPCTRLRILKQLELGRDGPPLAGNSTRCAAYRPGHMPLFYFCPLSSCGDPPFFPPHDVIELVSAKDRTDSSKSTLLFKSQHVPGLFNYSDPVRPAQCLRSFPKMALRISCSTSFC